MIEEVFANCPRCNEEIPFYLTVDELKRCPECCVDSNRLSEIVHDTPIEPVDETPEPLALTDGGASL